jgi:enoyl-CoA hydratase/carnithine racemase
MNPYQHWKMTVEDHIATLTLDRPEAENSLLLETLAELRVVTEDLKADKDTWAVILQGQGRHFCTGMDTSVLRSMPGQPEDIFKERLLEMQIALDEFEALEKPTIAKLHGFCLGGGLILALCCDFRIASQKTVLALPEIKIGIAILAGTQRITRTAGMAATKELVLLGKRLNAKTAHACGLVHQVLPADQLDLAVNALADKFRKLPPRATGIAKRIINQGYHLSLRESQDLEIEAQAGLLDSPDFHEAVASYLEKRTPRFIGE